MLGAVGQGPVLDAGAVFRCWGRGPGPCLDAGLWAVFRCQGPVLDVGVVFRCRGRV